MCCSLGHECGCRGKEAPVDYMCHLCDDLLVVDGDRLLGLCSPCFKSLMDVEVVKRDLTELQLSDRGGADAEV